MQLKIVPITEVLPGQIWGGFEAAGTNTKYARALIVESVSVFNVSGTYWQTEANGRNEFHIYDKHIQKPRGDVLANSLIGAIGVNYEIKDGKLVEIPRDEFMVGDVVEYRYTVCLIIRKEIATVATLMDSSGNCLGGVNIDTIKRRIGHIDITHKLTTERGNDDG